MQLRKFLLVCCLLLYCQSVSSQEYTDAPDDPDNLEIDTQYITEGLVSGTDFAGPNCTFRPSGHGVWGQGYAGYTNRNSDGYIGACPQISQDGTMRFSWSRNGGYVTATIDENSINETVQGYAVAFANSGIDVDGYSYSWYIKNADVGNASNSAAEGPYDPKTQDSLTIKIDFLDIDVEGADLKALEGLSFEIYKPELVCVEIHEKEIKQSVIYNLLINKDYELICYGIFSHLFKRL